MLRSGGEGRKEANSWIKKRFHVLTEASDKGNSFNEGK